MESNTNELIALHQKLAALYDEHSEAAKQSMQTRNKRTRVRLMVKMDHLRTQIEAVKAQGQKALYGEVGYRWIASETRRTFTPLTKATVKANQEAFKASQKEESK